MTDTKRIAPKYECWTCWHSPRAGVITNRPNLCCALPMEQRQHPLRNPPEACRNLGHDVRPVAQGAERG